MADLNGKDNTFTLKDFLYKEIQKDWPGYTEGDQQLLKRILFRYVENMCSHFKPTHHPVNVKFILILINIIWLVKAYTFIITIILKLV